jgi:hypothetical protein
MPVSLYNEGLSLSSSAAFYDARHRRGAQAGARLLVRLAPRQVIRADNQFPFIE